MKVNCPKCRSPYDYREACRDEDLSRILDILPCFASNSRLIKEYLGLFGAVRPLKPSKFLRLLCEMQSLWTHGRFDHGKRHFTISKEGIVEALEAVCNRTFTEPLTNHNYFKKVMINVADEEFNNARKEKDKKHAERESKLRQGRRPEKPEPVGSKKVGELIDKGSLPWNKKGQQNEDKGGPEG
ncbi:MAG: hypothetical protein KAR06_01095 [Deltaproteobacteria bacterium]|nr:hypothetical protein [Deltaproteobacteria bacterium]